MIAAIFLPCLLALSLIVQPLTASAADDQRPEAGVNNVWYHVEDGADTAIVFVHGLASDSRDAWFYKGDGAEEDAYWPAILRDDPVFAGSAIFLGGYHTEVDSHDYDFRDAANQLHRSLAIGIGPASSAVLDHPNILFVTHSAGGIVVRHMLTRHVEDFSDKAVGLVLIASPSIGSRDADRFEFIAELVRSKQGEQLGFNNPFLESLDKDFKNLVHRDKIPRLKGVEWLEHYLLFGMLGKIVGIGRDEVLVDEQSGGRYFGEPERMPGSDHVSIAKPSSRDHESHRALVYFHKRTFKKLIETSEQVAAPGDEEGVEEASASLAASKAESAAARLNPNAELAKTTEPAEPVRIDEKRSASLCNDRVQIELASVWKKGGGRPDDTVTVLSTALDAGKAVIKVGHSLRLIDGCSPTLVNTGRDSTYFAVFQ
ncbi:MAG: alpha/beta hydrolase [Pseudomonadota bacterium]